MNHITNTDGHLVGNNTDGAGFVRGLLADAGVGLSGARVGVAGAGGAARAIVAGCADAGADVVIVARNPDRAQAATAVAPTQAVVGAASDLSECAVVVNATPIGMRGVETDSTVPFDVDTLANDAVVVDIVYDPLETELLRRARERGLTAIDGLSMLVGQAAEQFTAWTGVDAPYEVMREAVR